MTPRVDPGRKGGIYPVPPAPVQNSPRVRLLEKAKANGWRWEVSSGPGDRLVHEDGSTLHVDYSRGSVTSAVLHPPTGIGRHVSDREVPKVIEGVRCCCLVLPEPDDNQLVPDPECALAHRYEHAELHALIARPVFCFESNPCGYCWHCTKSAEVAPYLKEVAVSG